MRSIIKNKRIYITFTLLVLIGILAYLFFWLITYDRDYVLTVGKFKSIMNRRMLHVIAITISASLIALASISFQTITQNRILTPSMLGFDSIFVATQTMIVYIFGRGFKLFINQYLNFILTTGVMILVSLFMYSLILRRNKNNIVLLLLAGLVLTSLLGSLTAFLTSLMSYDDFLVTQSATTATIADINTSIVYLAVPIMVLLIYMFYREHETYNVMALGEEQAINLGVNYHKKTNLSLVYISVAISVSTALIGPMTFLGLLAVNAAREILKTHKHKKLMYLSALIAVTFLVVGQLVVEQTKISTVVTVLIDLFGGGYMIYLILKESKK